MQPASVAVTASLMYDSASAANSDYAAIAASTSDNLEAALGVTIETIGLPTLSEQVFGAPLPRLPPVIPSWPSPSPPPLIVSAPVQPAPARLPLPSPLFPPSLPPELKDFMSSLPSGWYRFWEQPAFIAFITAAPIALLLTFVCLRVSWKRMARVYHTPVPTGSTHGGVGIALSEQRRMGGDGGQSDHRQSRNILRSSGTS